MEQKRSKKSKHFSKKKKSIFKHSKIKPTIQPTIQPTIGQCVSFIQDIENESYSDYHFTVNENENLNNIDEPNDSFEIKDIIINNDESNWMNESDDTNEINKFINKFGRFQYENSIGFVSESMNPTEWIEVDTFIFKYIYKLVCENKIRNVIYDYGISRSLVRLFYFYKNDLSIDSLQHDSEIIQYISEQSDSSINTDMALVILRDSIGFTSYKPNIFN